MEKIENLCPKCRDSKLIFYGDIFSPFAFVECQECGYFATPLEYIEIISETFKLQKKKEVVEIPQLSMECCMDHCIVYIGTRILVFHSRGVRMGTLE